MPEEIRWSLVATQIKASLVDGQEDIKTQTLKNAIVFATLYRDKVDLSGSVSAIREVYQHSKMATNQRLALAALQAIGTSRAQDFVTRNTTPEEYDAGRLVVASVLNDFYLAHTAATDAPS